MFNTLRKLVLGAGFGQLVSYLLLPIFTLVYTPIQLGYFSVIYSYAFIITVLFSCRMEIPLGMAKTIKDRNIAINALILILLISISIGLITVLILFFFDLAVGLSLTDYLLIGVIGLILTYERIGHHTIVSLRSPGGLSTVKALTPSLTLVGQILFPSIFMLFFSFISVRLILNYKYFRRIYDDFSLSLSEGYLFIMRHKNFLIYSTPSGLFSGLNNTFLVVTISNLVGFKAAGLIFLVQKITTAPVSLMSPAIHQSLMIHTDFSEKNSSELFNFNMRRIGVFLFSITLVTSVSLVLILFYLENYINTFLSKDWVDIVWLLPFFILVATVQINVMTFTIFYEFFQKQFYGLLTQIIVFIFKATAVFLAFSDGEMNLVTVNYFKDITILGYLIASAIFYFATRCGLIFVLQFIIISIAFSLPHIII